MLHLPAKLEARLCIYLPETSSHFAPENKPNPQKTRRLFRVEGPVLGDYVGTPLKIGHP